MKDDSNGDDDGKSISNSNYSSDSSDNELRSINLVMLSSVLNPVAFSKFSTDSK
jgi:hypothetical protein